MKIEVVKDIKPWILDLFSDLDKMPSCDLEEVEKMLCIFCTPRCGSTMFAECLNSSGQIGMAEEWFNYEYFAAWGKVVGKDDFKLSEYLTYVIKKTAREGVFSIKCHVAQASAMKKDFNFDCLSLKLDHCVYLRRRDKIAQAVSLAKAMQTNQFRHYESGQEAKLQNYDVAYALYLISDHELTGEQFHPVVNKFYYYEDFSTRRENFDEVLEALGKPLPALYQCDVKVQRDDASAEYARQFKEFIGVTNERN